MPFIAVFVFETVREAFDFGYGSGDCNLLCDCRAREGERGENMEERSWALQSTNAEKASGGNGRNLQHFRGGRAQADR